MTTTATTRVTRTVAEPLPSVWAALVDHEGMSDWAPGLRATIEKDGVPERHGAGAVRRIAAPGPAPAIVEEVTACEAPTRLAYRALSGVPFRGYGGEVVLRDLGERGTEVTWSLTITPRVGAERLALAGVNRGLVTLFLRSLRR